MRYNLMCVVRLLVLQKRAPTYKGAASNNNGPSAQKRVTQFFTVMNIIWTRYELLVYPLTSIGSPMQATVCIASSFLSVHACSSVQTQ